MTGIIHEFLVDKIIADYIEEYVQTTKPSYNGFLTGIQFKIQRPYMEASWSMGGTYGHYEGGLHESSPDPEPELEQLDDFLMKHYSTIGFLQYKKICRKIEVSTYHDSDYYGGSTVQATKKLALADLGEDLIALGFEQPSPLLKQQEINALIAKKYNIDWFHGMELKFMKIPKIKRK